MLSVEVAYKGSAADKELAGKMFQALSITGRFMAFDAPISMPIADLVELLGKLGTQTAARRSDRGEEERRHVPHRDRRRGGRFDCDYSYR